MPGREVSTRRGDPSTLEGDRMAQPRTLHLLKETLTELAPADLSQIAGGQLPTGGGTKCVTALPSVDGCWTGMYPTLDGCTR